MISEGLVDRVFEAVKQKITGIRRMPVTVYRLQFNRYFKFRDAARLVPYLDKLGVTDIYASPYLKARPGSLHGYDITDHNSLNPEIGTDEEYRSFVERLHEHKMGQVFDFVANHMSIRDNPWWTDVLENGPGSPFTPFFDVDWYPIKPELHEKVLLPILDDQYGKVLQAGDIRLGFDQGAFLISYYDYRLPVDPKTISLLCQPCLTLLGGSLGETHPDYLELQSIITACNNLPARTERAPQRVAERRRERDIIKTRLRELYGKSEEVKLALAETLKVFHGSGNLHEFLEAQAYRLSYWRVAADEINYRRFFDTNELIALRMENEQVFESSHQLLRQLFREGSVNGVRLDHIDGLFAPLEYLCRLQRACFQELCRNELAGYESLSSEDYGAINEKLSKRFEQYFRKPLTTPLFALVEKILVEKETLPDDWPVDGTTGYEFASALNGIFVNRRNARKILDIYRRFSGVSEGFREIGYRCKNLIMRTSLSADINVLAHQLDGISEASRWYRDFTLNSLRDTIREVIACFPVYRTYIDAFKDSIHERDKLIIDTAVAEAKRRNPAMSTSLFDFLHDTLLLKYPLDIAEGRRDDQCQFVMRFQQLTGAVMAKGVEDTAFYVYNPLVSLNEVGGNPGRFGTSLDDFHRQNKERSETFPHSLISTYTHDSKRSEDVRARINVLSEIPDEWRSALVRWSRLNRRKKANINGEVVPDRNEEYLIYQTLLGTYPLKEMDSSSRVEYQKRIRNYTLKALREAKVHTSWISPYTAYEEGVLDFISALLEAAPSDSFLADFLVLNRLVATCGMYNSLAQTVVKIFSPGTPDIYQGSELWDFSLVDPDNRRPVNFPDRVQLLNTLRKRVETSGLVSLAGELVNNMEDGLIKLYVTWKALTYRRANTQIFDGSYVQLKASGAKRAHICAFAWQKKNQSTIVVVPRLIAKLTGAGAIPPIDQQAWGATRLILPGRKKAKQYQNIFTGEIIDTIAVPYQSELLLAQVFSVFPVALLEQVKA